MVDAGCARRKVQTLARSDDCAAAARSAGAKVAELSPRLAQRLGLTPDTKGVTVIDINRDSPAAGFGFQPRDIVREVNGETDRHRRQAGAGRRGGARAGGASPSSATASYCARCCVTDGAILVRARRPRPRRKAPPGTAAGRPAAPEKPWRGRRPGAPDRAEDGALTRMIRSGSLGSMIFWGPPGTGKTTVARLLAGETSLAFEQISAVFSGVADLKKVFETREAAPRQRPPDAALRRRDPSLQPRPAG